MESEMQDPKIVEYLKLEQRLFPVAGVILIAGNDGKMDDTFRIDLKLEMHRVDADSGVRLSLAFFGVRELVLRQPHLSELHIGVLKINSIRDRQWDGLNYQVADSEKEILSFLCLDFDVISLE